MPIYDVRVFLLHCYVPVAIEIGNVRIEPFEGSGTSDIADLISGYTEKVLQQPPQPPEQKAEMSGKIKDDGSSVVFTFIDVEANDPMDALKTTEDALLLCRDIVSLRQLQRGTIAGFLVIQTDVSPTQLFSQVSHPYPRLRKIQNLPIGEDEKVTIARLLNKALKHPLLKIYLSLYADTLSYSDTFVTDTSIEMRLLKTWALLEAMAFSEPGSKKQKVKALFNRYQVDLYPNYHNHPSKDLLNETN